MKKCIAIQFFSDSGFVASPMPDEYELVNSKKAAMAAARIWFDECARWSSQPASVVVHYLTGEDLELPYPCDCYPDAIIEQGPRGGAVWCSL